MPPAPASTAWRVGRGLVLLAALVYGVLPAIIDLFTPQHLGDPGWTGHRRFHLIWQICLVFVVGARAGWLAWQAAPDRFVLLRRSAEHGALVLVAFFAAGGLTVPLGGAFGAPDEVLLGVPFPIIHFSLATAVLAAGLALAWRGSRGVPQTP